MDLMVAHSRRGRNDGGLILHGLRGVGKTVLLKRLQQIADQAGFITVSLEARPGESGKQHARQRLARGLALAFRNPSRLNRATSSLKQALRTVSAFTMSVAGIAVSADITPAEGRANSGLIEIDLEELIEDLSTPLRESRSTLAIFVDELQDLDTDLLTALLAAQHRASQEDLPFYLIGAGLPTVISHLATARSYTERFKPRQIGALNRDDAERALTEPAQRLGVNFTPQASDLVLEAAQGYPYFLQTYGFEIWEAAPSRTIDEAIASLGISEGNANLDESFFVARWDRTTAQERQYLRALATNGDSARTAQIAKQLGRTAQSFSPIRQSLIEKGIIYPERHGVVAFTVPNMPAFIARNGSDDNAASGFATNPHLQQQ